MKIGTLKLAIVLGSFSFLIPLYADRVDIKDASRFGALIPTSHAALAGGLSSAQVPAYDNPQAGIYTHVYTLGMPSATATSPAFHFVPGFSLDHLHWGSGRPASARSLNAGPIGAEASLPDPLYFTFSDTAPDSTITVYAQSHRPPSQFLGDLTENITHPTARGSLQAPVTKPGMLLLLGGSLSLASMAIRRRLRKKSSSRAD